MLLIAAGTILLVALLYNYAPRWAMYILCAIIYIGVPISAAIQKKKYWYYSYIKGEKNGVGVICSRQKKFPLKKLPYDRILFRLTCIEISKSDYIYYYTLISKELKDNE